jgi:hypothetical protein
MQEDMFIIDELPLLLGGMEFRTFQLFSLTLYHRYTSFTTVRKMAQLETEYVQYKVASHPFSTDGMHDMVDAHPEAFGRAVEK